MADDGMFSEYPKWQRPFLWVWVATTGLFMAAIVLLLIGGIVLFAYEKLTGADSTEPDAVAAANGETSTTTLFRPPTPSIAFSTSPPTTLDPSIGRPVYGEFRVLLLYHEELRSTCAVSYQNNIPACYDTFERGTDDFETKIRAALDSYVSAAITGSRGYNSNQYGCHDDGRCLDDYDEWCNESDVSYVDGFGLACPGTLQWINEQAAWDDYQDQMEQERYDDYYP